MRIAHNDVSLAQAFMTAASEAERAFGNPDLYMEKFVEKSRHIEVQLMADKHGNVVQLAERDCSIQRRHQKLVEEAPSPAVDDDLRQRMGRRGRQIAEMEFSVATVIEKTLDLYQNMLSRCKSS